MARFRVCGEGGVLFHFRAEYPLKADEKAAKMLGKERDPGLWVEQLFLHRGWSDPRGKRIKVK